MSAYLLLVPLSVMAYRLGALRGGRRIEAEYQWMLEHGGGIAL